MYTIKQAAARSGLSVPTVRVWERRYGVVHPERTPSGYRLYDEAAIARLIAMRHLVEVEGIRPSQAADQILASGTDVAELVDAARAASAWPRERALATPPADRVSEAVAGFVAAARALDVGEMERILDEAFAAERFEGAVDHVVFPALRTIGDDWFDGAVDVAMEHAASETIRRRLARFYDAVASSTGAPDLIVGLPPGGHHEIGALAFAIAARRQGLDVLYLGADVPVDSWRVAVEETGARLTVIGVVGAGDVAAADLVVGTLLALARAPIAALGGRRAREVRGVDGGMVVLPERIDEAIDVILRLAGSGP
jgi:DNA-binding transcriptional MerR regulator/methanogenic corrinoid protein MtbC1